MNISINELINLLQESGDSDNVKLDVTELVNNLNKQKVLDIHSYAITEPDKMIKGSRWSTYVKGDDGKRKKITSTTEYGLFEKLHKFYFIDSAITLKSMFPDWVQKRKEQGTSASTIQRNINDWNKFYLDNKIVTVPIQKISVEQIESFFNSCISTYHLTAKALGNMKFIIQELFKLAFKRKYISYNPMHDVDIYMQGCEPPKKHKDSDRVYLPEEREKLFYELNKELVMFPNKTDSYAVFFMFTTGLRIGELVALKWSDIDYDSREIHICRIESKDYNASGDLRMAILEHTKKKSISGDRYISLGDYELELLEKVSSINKRCCFKETEFIFCDELGRTNRRSIDNLIRKCCKRANIPVIKSAHDIRRTVASVMSENGVNIKTIQNMLGHSDINTTYGYIYDSKSKSERNNQIHNSLIVLNGFSRTQAYSIN